ncbi:MAG: WXG100 family type VII secretion target [Lachnospiraceae bacterium]|nr:WXG100 family type VII secretion target [Lachnospiraceae bacterium]
MGDNNTTPQVEELDSERLNQAALTLKSSIEKYNEIVHKISTETNSLLGTWYGKGKTEFEKDYSTVYQQLSDISDIMYDLYDSLVDSDAIYIQADESIAKSLHM